ncbi:hypothetical protein MES4922_550035 [Mesorhizobium ventifaucium]|uniref:Uncharacterized protein n=1 Tax=Mesorhizobium ventifaucium TaxID=666020 RepID=A0ABN8KB43_9HYPH|nr:hypothetical protein MES4922_550035 [Mesorhizobium ventifaucium]
MGIENFRIDAGKYESSGPSSAYNATPDTSRLTDSSHL